MKNKSISKKSDRRSPKSEVRDLTSDLRSRISDRGFTLLEILVAMGLLMVIVLMMSTLFHASTTAWTNGLRQAEMSIQARSVISLIQRDVSQAVFDEELQGLGGMSLVDGADTLTVYTPGGMANTNRLFREVKYASSGIGSADGGVITRKERLIDPSAAVGDYGSPGSWSTDSPLVGNVDEFEVTVPSGGPYTTNLPAWVGVKVTLSQDSEGSAGFKVSSMGRNRVEDSPGDPDDDDVRTWR
jgi:type II secretory pathway pseudopilin PulG